MQTTLWRRISITAAFMMILAVPFASHAQNGTTNDMARGGISSTSDLISILSKGDGVHSAKTLQQDYADVHVTINGLKTYTAHNGYVTKTGQVILNDGDKVVATNAYSYGRSDLGNSTKISDHLYKRSTQTSFAQSKLDAIIYTTKDGGFKYAVIKECGNVVTASPKAVSKTAPKPAVQTSTTVVNVTQVQAQTQAQAQTQTVTPTPAPAPTPTPAPAPAPTLPQTGATAFGMAAALTGLTVALRYYLRGRRDLQLAWARIGRRP